MTTQPLEMPKGSKAAAGTMRASLFVFQSKRQTTPNTHSPRAK